MMDFKQLEAFVAVVNHMSFSEAAKYLFLTQPTVSMHIKELEAELGKTLLVRTTKKITLTPDGEKLYGYASGILCLRKKALGDLCGQKEATIRIGASTLPVAYFLPAAVAQFRQRNPEVDFDIWKSDSLGVIEKLLDGTLDFGLTGTKASEKQCVFEPFCEDELVIAAPANRHFKKLKKENAPIEVLLQTPLILREKGSGTRRETERLLARIGFPLKTLKVAACMNDPESIPSSILAGVGVSILSRKVAEDLEASGKLLAFSFNSPLARRSLYIVRGRDRFLTKQNKEFIRLLKEMYSKPSAPSSG